MRNVSDKVVQKIKTRILFNNFFPENRAVYEITWKNPTEPSGHIRQIIRRRKNRFTCRINKSEYKKHAHNNAYLFSMAKIVTRKRLCYGVRALPAFLILKQVVHIITTSL